MPTIKKLSKKESSGSKAVPKITVAEKYFQGIGRRKLAISRIKIFEAVSKKESKTDIEILVNKKSLKIYFSLPELRDIVEAPLKAVSADGISRISVLVRGGGIRGQAEATRLGISRALVLKNQDFKKTLKDLGYLTRDARIVERKKAGLKKARRAPQFSKR